MTRQETCFFPMFSSVAPQLCIIWQFPRLPPLCILMIIPQLLLIAPESSQTLVFNYLRWCLLSSSLSTPCQTFCPYLDRFLPHWFISTFLVLFWLLMFLSHQTFMFKYLDTLGKLNDYEWFSYFQIHNGCRMSLCYGTLKIITVKQVCEQYYNVLGRLRT